MIQWLCLHNKVRVVELACCAFSVVKHEVSVEYFIRAVKKYGGICPSY